MAYIKFARNQTNAANEIMIPAESIINIVANDAISCIIQYNWGHGPDASPAELLTLTLQVGATGAATLTRANIVEKVIDTIQKTGLSGIAAQVPDMEVQVAAWSSTAIDATP